MTYTDSDLELAMAQCAAEPIHQLGFIQPHGVALVLSPASPHTILQVSENLAELLGMSADHSLDKPLHFVLGKNAAHQVEKLIATAFQSKPSTAIGVIDFSNQAFNKLDAHVFISDGFPVLELSNDASIAKPENLTELILKNQVLLLDDTDDTQLTDYLYKTAVAVRELMAYDNVMIYKFDEDWNGQVIAQSRCDAATNYLGLHFPASDIPVQARALYKQNLVRVVTDVDALPVAFTPALNPHTQAPLNLSASSLRSLSPIHMEYLRNMGTAATMTISLLQNGELWGLIACHHLTPKRISVTMRETAYLISKMIASKLTKLELAKNHQLTHSFLDLNLQIVDLLSKISTHQHTNLLQELKSILNATGIIVIVDGERFISDITPTQHEINSLINWLEQNITDGYYVSSQLSSQYNEAAAFQDKASGLLAVSSDNSLQNCIIWLRQEKLQTVNWAGAYSEGLNQNTDGQYQLTPRQSFEAWSETWRGRSEAWSEAELKLAQHLKKSIIESQQRNYLNNQLLKAQQALDELANLIPSGIVITDAQRRITFVNKDFEHLTGYSCQELIGKPCSILQGPDTDLKQIQAIRNALNEQKTFVGELVNYKKDGSIFWNELSINPIFNNNHQLTQFIGIQRDITAKKLHQTELTLSEQRFRELSNAAPTLIWQADCHKNRFWFNKSWLEFTGRSLVEELNQGWMEGLHPEDQAPYMSIYNRSFDKKDAFRIEYRLRRADGEYRWIDGQGVPQFSSDGVFEGYLGTCTDITDVRNSKAATDYFDIAHEMIYSTNLDGMIVDCNQRFSEITGYSRDDVIGQNVRILKSGEHDKDFYVQMWQAILNQGFWRGEIINRHQAGHHITLMTTISVVPDSQNKPKRYLAVASDISSIIEKRQHFEQLAHYDNLTGLANRLLLMDRLNHAMSGVKRRGGFIALLFIDLDGFKSINDHYGHEMGDEFLIAISHKMKEAIRDTDTLARLGGDEFIIILDELNNTHYLEVAIPRILAACNAELFLRETAIKVSASIGISLYPKENEGFDIDVEMLLAQADQAMYVAKQRGKNCYHQFDRTQDQIIITRNNSIEAIRLGISRDEFELHYQPKVNMATGEVYGFEALIRWNKNHTELLAPSKFLFIVQNHPLGIELGYWVIKSALKQLNTWNEHGLKTSISVNVDARQLMQTNFIEILAAEINKQPNFKGGSLELEILETTAIEDRLLVSKVLNRCLELGLELALDDFGTGYSSITYLRDFPVKTIKIDRSFIMGISHSEQDFNLVSHIIHMANDMGKHVIAEGIESIEQGELLLSMGCELGQGYVIAKPMPASHVLAWVKDWQSYPTWLKATKSDRNYHLFFESMADPMLIIKNGRFVDCNAATIKFLGYSNKERFLNLRPSDISPTFQPDGQCSEEKARAILELVHQTGYECFEWLHLRADNSQVLVEVKLTLISTEHEQIQHVAWRDLTESMTQLHN